MFPNRPLTLPPSHVVANRMSRFADVLEEAESVPE
jgi:hypothetical protein